MVTILLFFCSTSNNIMVESYRSGDWSELRDQCWTELGYQSNVEVSGNGRQPKMGMWEMIADWGYKWPDMVFGQR